MGLIGSRFALPAVYITTLTFGACSGDGAAVPKEGSGGEAGRLLEPFPDAQVPDVPPFNPDAGIVLPSDGFTAGAGGMGGNGASPGHDAGAGGLDSSGGGRTGPVQALTPVQYRFSLFYHQEGSVQDIAAEALLNFSASDPCALVSAQFNSTFDPEFIGVPPVGSDNLINICQPFWIMKMQQGLFDAGGVTLRFRNESSDPNDRRLYTVESECDGQGISDCSGALAIIE